MLITEMVNEICGADEMGKAKCGITIDLTLWNSEEDEIKDVKTITLFKPIIKIIRSGEYVQVDLKFFTSLDRDFHVFWNTIEQYGDMLEEYASKIEKSEALGEEIISELPFFSLTIVPNEWDWAFHMTGICPITWSLMPEQPGEEALIVRILFKEDNVGFYQMDNFDIDTIEAEEERKIAILEQSMLQAMIEKEKKEEESSN